jgi:hypothetical protein
MDTRTGEIRTLAPGERPGPHKVPLTSEQAKSLSRLTPRERLAALGALVHGAARPAGLTDDEWRAQKNAAKRQRRARRGL